MFQMRAALMASTAAGAGPSGPEKMIFVGFGASDMAGFSSESRRTDNASRSNLYQIPLTGTSAGTAALATEPLTWAYYDSQMVSSALAGFGRQMADDNPSDTVVLVPAARYVTGLNSGGYFDPSAPGALYTAGKNGINAAETQFPGSSLRAILFGSTGRHVQDSFSIETSKATLNSLISATRTDQGAANAPFIAIPPPYLYGMGLERDASSGQASGYQEWLEYLRAQQMAQANWAYVAPPVRFIDDLIANAKQVRHPTSENHLDQETMAALGTRAATLFPLIAGLTAGAPDAITAMSDNGKGWLKLTIPASGLTKVVLRYRQNGTSDAWTEIDRWPHWLGQLPGETMFCNIPDTNNVALEVQVKAVSYGGESAWSSSQVIAAVQRAKGWRVNATALNGRAAFATFEVVFAPETGGPDMLMLDAEGSFAGNYFDGSHPSHQVHDGWTDGESYLSANNAYSSGLAYVGIYFNEPTFVGAAQVLCGPDTASTERILSAGSIGRCSASNTRAQCQGGGGATWTSVISISGQTGWSVNEVRTFT